MTDDIPSSGGEAEFDLAGEYVLGVLDSETRARAADRLRHDPVFLAEVQAWEARLAPMLDDVAEARPPSRLWDRLAERVDLSSNVAAFRAPSSLWDRVSVWRGATGALAAAASIMAVAIAVGPTWRAHPQPPPAIAPRGQVLTSTLAAPGGRILFVAIVDPAHRGVTVVPVGGVDGRGRSPELWIIQEGRTPRAVGLLEGAHPLSVVSSALAGAGSRTLFAVSLEPAGGSPTGAPTGPVIASGPLTPA